MSANQNSWANLKIGIVVLIGLVIFVFMVSTVGTEQNIFSSTYSLKFFMPNVQGLVNGAMVTLGGLKVGYVKDMQFTTKDTMNGVEVTVSVLSKYQSSITTGSVAQIKTIGLLGDKYIDIGIGRQGQTPLAENSFIPLRESFDLEAAGPQLKAALADFTEVMGNAKRITGAMDKGEGSVGKFIKQPNIANEMERFLSSMNAMMAAVERKQGALGKFVYDETLSKNIADVSTNMKTVTDQIRQGEGSLGKLVMDDRLYNDLSSFTSRADSLMAKASGDSSNVSKLITDQNFYTDLVKLMRDMNLLLVDLREHPERYVKFSVF
jgi:phospholipid/cholesterol/gamma-HCH transport system substrate-binding protein